MLKYLKKMKLISLIVISLFLVTNLSAQKAQKVAKTPKTETVVFSVKMDCESCLNKIKKQLAYEKGVKDLYLSLADDIVAIKFTPAKTDKEKLMAVIKKLEFEVTEIQSKESLPDKWQ